MLNTCTDTRLRFFYTENKWKLYERMWYLKFRLAVGRNRCDPHEHWSLTELELRCDRSDICASHNEQLWAQERFFIFAWHCNSAISFLLAPITTTIIIPYYRIVELPHLPNRIRSSSEYCRINKISFFSSLSFFVFRHLTVRAIVEQLIFLRNEKKKTKTIIHEEK